MAKKSSALLNEEKAVESTSIESFGLVPCVMPLDKLIPYARNSRTHSDQQIADIAASIKEFGFKNPIIIDQKNTIRAGHGRFMAAQKLNLQVVPCLRGDLSEIQWKAFVIADNRLAEKAGWDNDLLKLELQELNLEQFDVAITGFDMDDLASFMGPDEPQGGRTDADDTPEPDETKVICRPGDLWTLGNHKLICGDATDPEVLKRLVGEEKVAMWLTDPPYNVAYEGKTEDALTIQNDHMTDADFRTFLFQAYKAADGVMAPGAVFYIWHADSEGFNFRGAARDVGWKVRQCLIWQKQTLVMGRQDYHWKHEPCLYGWKEGAAHYWASDRKQTTILEFDKPARNGEHPTMKPVALFAYQLGNNTRKGDLVLDSFGGSGTTLIAAEQLGRKARLCELDPKYCDVIIRRFQAFTGQQAIREDQRAFDEL